MANNGLPETHKAVTLAQKINPKLDDSEPKQLALPVTLPDDELFDSFHPAANQHLVSHLRHVTSAAQNKFSFTFLCGGGQTGKSHLLYAACVNGHENGLTNMLLPMDQLIGMKAQILEGIESYDIICVDNFELIAGKDDWENGFFYLFNLLDAAGKTLIVAANSLPDQLNIHLPDLLSRLHWGVTFQLKALTDQDKKRVLQMRSKLRGLALSDDAARFMVSRLSRDISSLIKTLDQLDKASIAAKRKLTIPFIKATLSL